MKNNNIIVDRIIYTQRFDNCNCGRILKFLKGKNSIKCYDCGNREFRNYAEVLLEC